MKKIFSSRTTGLISSKLGTTHTWMERIQFCSYEGSSLSASGDNSKIVKIYLKYLKIFLFRTTRSISTKLGTKHPWVEEIQVCSNEGLRPSQRGDKSEMVKLYWKYSKILSSKLLGQLKTNLAQSILGQMKFKFLKQNPTPFNKGS